MMKNQKIWLGLGVLLLLMAMMLGIWLATRPETAAGKKTFTVCVTHGDGSEKTFRYETAAEYLGAVLLAEGLIEGSDGPYGLMIDTVDGEAADWNVDKGYWALYIGEDYATTGIDTTPVTDGGLYRLVYTRG